MSSYFYMLKMLGERVMYGQSSTEGIKSCLLEFSSKPVAYFINGRSCISIYPAVVAHSEEILLLTRKTNCTVGHQFVGSELLVLGLWMLELLLSRESFEEAHNSSVGKLF